MSRQDLVLYGGCLVNGKVQCTGGGGSSGHSEKVVLTSVSWDERERWDVFLYINLYSGQQRELRMLDVA